MDYDVVITNGTILSADGETKADVAIRGETIAAVGPGLAAQAGAGTEIIDATGRQVIPGGVDVHVHLELPFCGTVSSDDWNTGTRAAARGGVTTVIDFAIPYGQESLHDAFNNWMARAKPKACVDYCFHIAITNWDRHGPEIEKMVAMGCPTFKEFMIYASEGWQADDRAIYNTLEKCRDLGGMLLVHAESSRVLDELIARYHTPELMQQHGARLHALSRPNFIEAEAIQRAITWAEVTGGRLYIVHMSTAQGTDLVKAAQARGVDVYAETCASTSCSTTRPSTGPTAISSPVARRSRKRATRSGSGRDCKTGEVSVISTDTCTFSRAQKARWEGDWTKIPMGLPGLETLLPIVYTHGVLAGPAHAGRVRRQVLHQPGQADGTLSQERRHRRRGATPTSRSSTPRSGSWSITRRWKPTPTGARTRAGRWLVSPRPRLAAAGRSSLTTSSSARAAGAAGCRASGRDRSQPQRSGARVGQAS